jgi:hypothetical protein
MSVAASCGFGLSGCRLVRVVPNSKTSLQLLRLFCYCYCWHLIRQYNIILLTVFMALNSPQKKTRNYLRCHLTLLLYAMVVVYSYQRTPFAEVVLTVHFYLIGLRCLMRTLSFVFVTEATHTFHS